jgi:hypothetical protein
MAAKGKSCARRRRSRRAVKWAAPILDAGSPGAFVVAAELLPAERNFQNAMLKAPAQRLGGGVHRRAAQIHEIQGTVREATLR